MKPSPSTTIPRRALTGVITIRRLTPPQIETEATISKGKVTEELRAIGVRVGLEESDDEPLSIGNEQGLCIMGKLFAQQIYYLCGGTLSYGNTQYKCNEGAESSVLWSFDERTLLHEPLNHRSPETPYRLQRAVEALRGCQRAALILPSPILALPLAPDPGNKSQFQVSRFATLEEITLFHDPNRYKNFIEKGEVLDNLRSDVYCNEGTSSCAARLSAGAVIDVSSKVLKNISCERMKKPLSEAHSTLGFCLIRPPGHHCTSDTPSGFCLVNNVAVAAASLLRGPKVGLEVEGTFRSPKIAIIDLDVHFGEGTASFVDNYVQGDAGEFPLLYLSLHRYDNGSFYPFHPEGSSDYTGNIHKGCIFNAGINTNASDPEKCYEVISDFLLEKIIKDSFIPQLQKFQPDIVYCSLGFDAAYGDPLGKMAVEGGFAQSIRLLKEWCLKGIVGLIVVLEGGYNPESVSSGVLSVAHALTFSADDLDVQNFCRPCMPKVWSDIRKRQERNRKSDQNAILVDGDDILFEKHRVWCDAVVNSLVA